MNSMRIIAILRAATRQLSFMMDRNMVYTTMQRIQAKSRVEQLISKLSGMRDEDCCIAIAQSRADLVEIMPPACGRYKNLRNRILSLIDEAEKQSRERLTVTDFAIGV